ncbi:MAG: hypothetical protein M1837_002759 [Sclerophora amabilis]|nr:MAG: hypothetical protein M1837_002759 [Sclerophora amabilis]
MAAPNDAQPPAGTASSTDRIKQLNAIDADITRLLRCASNSVKILTNTSSSRSASPSSPSLSARQASFSESTDTYYTLLSSINTRLRRQVLALQEAGIVSAGATSKEMATTAANGDKLDPGDKSAERSAEMGMGSLDIGWLNSRNDSVGNEMDADLWAKARAFLEELEGKKNDSDMGEDHQPNGDNSADVSMGDD